MADVQLVESRISGILSEYGQPQIEAIRGPLNYKEMERTQPGIDPYLNRAALFTDGYLATLEVDGKKPTSLSGVLAHAYVQGGEQGLTDALNVAIHNATIIHRGQRVTLTNNPYEGEKAHALSEALKAGDITTAAPLVPVESAQELENVPLGAIRGETARLSSTIERTVKAIAGGVAKEFGLDQGQFPEIPLPSSPFAGLK